MGRPHPHTHPTPGGKSRRAPGRHHLHRATRVASDARPGRHGRPSRSRPASRPRRSRRPAAAGPGALQSRRGAIRDATLALLAEQPMHGYQVMQELAERSGGRWHPSAGSVYPTLQQLEDEGLVTVEDRDGRRTFALTDAGRTAATAIPAERPWARRERGDDLGGLVRELGVAAHAGDPRREPAGRRDRLARSSPRRGARCTGCSRTTTRPRPRPDRVGTGGMRRIATAGRRADARRIPRRGSAAPGRPGTGRRSSRSGSPRTRSSRCRRRPGTGSAPAGAGPP